MANMTADASQIAALLESVPLCDGLDAASLTAMAGQMRWREFAAGETLAAAGSPVTEFWIVIEGEIEAYLSDAHGRESLLGVIRKGETIGEVAIIQHSYCLLRFTSRTSGTLLTVPAEGLHAWLEAYPPLMRSLFRTLSQRFKQAVGIRDRALPAPRLGIVAPSPRARRLAGRLVARLSELGERLRVWSDDPAALRSGGQWPESITISTLDDGASPLPEPCPAEVDRRVIVWSPGADLPRDRQRAASCDHVLHIAEASEANTVGERLLQILGDSAGLIDRVQLVWLVDPEKPISPCLTGWQWRRRPICMPMAGQRDHGDGPPHRLERQGLDRLVRSLRGYSLGIALAGGGAKGMAHLGVLRVLEDAGLSFDAMSGTSAGAMAGITYAAGMPPRLAVERFQNDLLPSALFRLLPKWPNWYLLSQFRRRAWDVMLRRYLHDWRLEQLPIPFYSVAADLVQAQTLVRDQGDAVHAILESINLPVLSAPILRDGMVLVDGGILNALPADVLVERDVDFVIGVDVSTRMRHEFAKNRPDTPTSQMKPPGTLDTMLRIFETQAHNLCDLRNRAVDFWITPDTSGFRLADFYRATEIAEVGERAAEARLPELQQHLAELKRRFLGSVATLGAPANPR
jgi:predicted acylesterase/phospholipase RssA/CRP-like cAMP-binding protein